MQPSALRVFTRRVKRRHADLSTGKGRHNARSAAGELAVLDSEDPYCESNSSSRGVRFVLSVIDMHELCLLEHSMLLMLSHTGLLYMSLVS